MVHLRWVAAKRGAVQHRGAVQESAHSLSRDGLRVTQALHRRHSRHSGQRGGEDRAPHAGSSRPQAEGRQRQRGPHAAAATAHSLTLICSSTAPAAAVSLIMGGRLSWCCSLRMRRRLSFGGLSAAAEHRAKAAWLQPRGHDVARGSRASPVQEVQHAVQEGRVEPRVDQRSTLALAREQLRQGRRRRVSAQQHTRRVASGQGRRPPSCRPQRHHPAGPGIAVQQPHAPSAPPPHAPGEPPARRRPPPPAPAAGTASPGWPRARTAGTPGSQGGHS